MNERLNGYQTWVEDNPFRKWRIAKGWSAMQAAAQMSVALNTVANWEKGGSPPNDDNTRVMAELMELSVSDLTAQWMAWKSRRPVAA